MLLLVRKFLANHAPGLQKIIGYRARGSEWAGGGGKVWGSEVSAFAGCSFLSSIKVLAYE